MNYRELADLPDGRKYWQLEIIKNQATILSVKEASPNVKDAKSAAIIYAVKLLRQNC